MTPRPLLLALLASFAALPAPLATASHPERFCDATLTCTASADAADPSTGGTTGGNTVKLSWNVVWKRLILGWQILRDGEAIAKLAPDASGYVDPAVPDGEHEYDLQALDFDGSVIPVGCCKLVVGEFGARCEPIPGTLRVKVSWDFFLRVLVDGFVVTRDGVVVATAGPEAREVVDTVPGPGTYRYVVRAEVGFGHSILVGACTAAVPRSGLACTVDGPLVQLDWSAVPLPAVVIERFDVFRDGERIGQSRETRFTDAPGPGEHAYKVLAVAGTSSGGIVVGSCVVVVGGGGVPAPRDLTCAVAIPTRDPAVAGDPDGGIWPSPFVSLRWTNPIDYDLILVSRNGMPIARLPGGTTRFVDRPPVFQGRFLYEVRGVVGDRRSEAASCLVELGPPGVPPPENLRCAVDDRVLAPVTVVLLTWTNPFPYAGIVVRRDGRELAVLPGDATAYRDAGPPSGVVVYSVQGISAEGVASEEVACKVDTGGGLVPPVRDLTCLAVVSSAAGGVPAGVPGDATGGATGVLTWVNGGRYEKILIERTPGPLEVTIPGDATGYKDPGLERGTLYTYSVRGASGGLLSAPAYCRILAGGEPPENLLTFSSGLFREGAAGGDPVPLAVPGSVRCLARNADPIQGWSFGVRADPRFIVPEKVSLDDTATAKLNDGQGPTFLSLNVVPDGITMGVIVDEKDLTDTLPPPVELHALAEVTYLQGPEGEPGGEYPVAYSETLGDPPVAVIFVVKGFEVRPATERGVVRLPRPLPFPPFLRGDANGDGLVDMSDAVSTLAWLFLGGPGPGCLEAADANASAQVNIGDPIYTLQHRFSGGPPPPAPFPDCGRVELALGCEEPSCPSGG
ncbi:MAG: hypothetical protein HY721_00830 [Planctomycetes bacterium]|nr:hypothetical protein [Planctomycetota bacterium]